LGSPTLVLASSSPESTRHFGRATATVCRPGDVVALIGDVGAGKTTYAQGIGEGLGVGPQVTSSTFVLVSQYRGDELDLYHIDLYRLDSPEEVRSLDLDEYLYGEGVTVLEWADKFPSILPDEYLRVSIDYSGHERRTIRVVGIGQRGCAMAEELRESLDGSQ
jgi:tRNA threonylcarbamoyladenosine biosynthesis protein TsaE